MPDYITFMTVVAVPEGTDTSSMGAQMRISAADRAAHRDVLAACLESIGVKVEGMDTAWADGWRTFVDATATTKAFEFPEAIGFLEQLAKEVEEDSKASRTTRHSGKNPRGDGR